MKLHRFWRRFRAVVRKEALHIVRDPRSLGTALVLPLLQLLLFGYAIRFDIREVKTAVVDRDRSEESRGFVDGLTSSGLFSVVDRPSSGADLDALLARGKVRMGIVVPHDFERDLERGGAKVQVLVDGTDANFATAALGYFMAYVQRASTAIARAAARRSGRTEILRAFPPIRTQLRIWFNEDLRSENFVVPGVIAMVLMTLAAQLTSIAVAREYEHNTMEQLVVSPIHRLELLLGKLVPYVGLGFAQVALVVLAARLLFHVPIRGSLVLMTFATALFLAGAMALGLFFSVATRSQQVAQQISIIATMLPAVILSGFVFPIESMPKVLQAVTLIVPARYYLVVLRGIFLKGVGISVLWPQLLWLALFALGISALCARTFRKSLE